MSTFAMFDSLGGARTYKNIKNGGGALWAFCPFLNVVFLCQKIFNLENDKKRDWLRETCMGICIYKIISKCLVTFNTTISNENVCKFLH